ncbi:hypothetical protein V5O48_012579 [Marasmius crinis-equi]|uniref:Ubiquitin-like protease family profile domain-containing protein n=1 Tax=Marasmius crinis-equi TaxID=585013 RepID=A0ABR3F2P4_9AGAR
MEAAGKRRKAKDKMIANETVRPGEAPNQTVNRKGTKAKKQIKPKKEKKKQPWDQGPPLNLNRSSHQGSEQDAHIAGPSHHSEPDGPDANGSGVIISSNAAVAVLQLTPQYCQKTVQSPSYSSAPSGLAGDRTLAITDWGHLPWTTRLLKQTSIESKFLYLTEDLKPALGAILRDTANSWRRVANDVHLTQLLLKGGVKVASSANTPIFRTMWNTRLLEVLTLCAKDPAERLGILATCSFPRTRFYRLKPVAGLTELKNWPTLIHALKASLDEAKSSLKPAPAPQKELGDCHQLRLLLWQASSFTFLNEQAHLAHVLENLAAVVLYISLFKSGQVDLPKDKEELQSYLTEITPVQYKEQYAPEIATAKYQRPPARLRGPLYAALGISPLILLTNCDLADNDIKRVDLVQHWMHMGNVFPPVVRTMEFMIWECVLRTAEGQMDIVQSFTLFATEASRILVGKDLGTNDRDFFRIDFGESFNKERAEPVLAAFIEELPDSGEQHEVVPDEERESGGEISQALDSSGGGDIVTGFPLNDAKANESLDEGQNVAKGGDSLSEASVRDTAAAEQTKGAGEPKEDAEGQLDVAPPVKLAPAASEESRVEASDRDGDVAMADSNPLEQTGSSAKLASDPSGETEGTLSITPGDAEHVTMAEADPSQQTAPAGGDAKGVGLPIEDEKGQSDPMLPTTYAPDAPENTSNSNEAKSVSEANMHGEQGVDSQGQGGDDADDAGVSEPELQNQPDPEATMWIDNEIICIAGDENDSEMSDISGFEGDDTDTDNDTDIDHEVAVAAGLKGSTRPTWPRAKAKAAPRTGTTSKKRKKGSVKRGRKRNVKKKVAPKKSAKEVGEEDVNPSEIPPLKLGKAPKRFYARGLIQLADYKGGKPLTFAPESYASSDLQDLFKLLSLANVTNTQHLRTPLFSRTLTDTTTANPTPSHPKPHPALLVVTHEEILKRSRSHQQELFRHANILIKGCWVPQHEQKWNEDNLSTIGDMDEMREMHALWLRGKGSAANDQIRKGTFRDILYEGGREGGLLLNCLDIPGLPSHDGYKVTQLQSCARAYQHGRKPGVDLDYPLDTSVWHLLATKHASHYAHVDTSGYGTMIAPQIGTKLFFLLLPASGADDFDRTNGSLRFGETAHNMENEVGMVVVPVILRPGDVLLMRPCTYHYVLTLESSLCHGSHFVCASTITDTCYGILHDFTHHDSITNQDDVVHRHTLARLVIYWKKRLVDSHSQFFSRADGVPLDDLPNFKSFEGIMGFLSVYNIILLESIIWPERYCGQPLDEGVVEMYKEAKASAESLLTFLDTNIRIELVELVDKLPVNRDDDDPNLSGKSRLYDIRNRHLIHQVRSLHIALQRLDESRGLLFQSAVMKDIRRFPKEVGAQLKKVFMEELEDPSYYWPGRYRTNSSRWAIYYDPPAVPSSAYTIDDYHDRSAESGKLSSQSSSQPSPSPSPSPSQSPADPHAQERDPARDPPSPSPQRCMDIDSHETLPGGAKSGGEARSDTDMDVDQSDGLEGETTEMRENLNDMAIDASEGVLKETNEEGGDTENTEEGMDIDGSDQVAGKANEEEIPSTEAGRGAVTKEPPGDSKLADPGKDNQAILETGGNLGELVEEPQGHQSSAATSDSAGTTTMVSSDSEFEIGDVQRLKRVMRSPEGQRKRRKVNHLLRLSTEPPKGLVTDSAEKPWFLEADLGVLDVQKRCQSWLRRIGPFPNAEELRTQLEDPAAKLNADILNFSTRILQVFLQDERCSLFSSFMTEQLMTACSNTPTWPVLGRGKWCYWDKAIWVFPLFLRGAHHWALAVLKAETRQILLFDSLGMRKELNAALKNVQLAVQRAVQDAEENGHTIPFPSFKRLEDWAAHQVQPTAVQTTNYVECGLWTAFAVSGVFRGYDHCQMDEKYAPQFREFLSRLTRLATSAPAPADAVTPSPTAPLSPKPHSPHIPSPAKKSTTSTTERAPLNALPSETQAQNSSAVSNLADVLSSAFNQNAQEPYPSPRTLAITLSEQTKRHKNSPPPETLFLAEDPTSQPTMNTAFSAETSPHPEESTAAVDPSKQMSNEENEARPDTSSIAGLSPLFTPLTSFSSNSSALFTPPASIAPLSSAPSPAEPGSPSIPKS